MRKLLILATITLTVGTISGQAQTLAVKTQIVNKLIAEDQLTQAKVRERGGVNKIITVKSLDLNKDGKPEYIVDCACENMEAVYVLRKSGNSLQIIYWGTQREIVTPLKSYTNGWLNLRSTVYQSVDGSTSTETLRWNGSEYK